MAEPMLLVVPLDPAIHWQFGTYLQPCPGRRVAGENNIAVRPAQRRRRRNGRRLAFNSAIAANWTTFADHIAQLSALNWTPGGSFATYYQDGVHPNAAGQALAAAAILAEVNVLL